MFLVAQNLIIHCTRVKRTRRITQFHVVILRFLLRFVLCALINLVLKTKDVCAELVSEDVHYAGLTFLKKFVELRILLH